MTIDLTPALNFTRIAAVMQRHWIVLRRSPHRWFEISFWPLMDVLLWGSLGVYAATQSTQNSATGVTGGVQTTQLLAGLTLFWILTQAQFAIALGVNEETWTRNILNVLTTPITEAEYIIGIALFGMVKLAMCVVALTLATTFLFSFNIISVGWTVIPVMLLLIVNGWAFGLFAVGLVLRFGQSAEILIWGINYALLAFSGVFFPTQSMPKGIGSVAKQLPTSRLFSILRQAVEGVTPTVGSLGAAALASLVFFVIAVAFANNLLKLFRRRGYVTRYS
jgi:ABC-2 type transport system permease protein